MVASSPCALVQRIWIGLASSLVVAGVCRAQPVEMGLLSATGEITSVETWDGRAFFGGFLSELDVTSPGGVSVIGQTRTRAWSMAVDGGLAVVSELGDLVVYSLETPGQPRERSRIDIGGNTLLALRDGVVCSSYPGGVRFYDVSDPDNPVELGSVAVDGLVADIVLTDTRALLAVFTESDAGFRAVDVSDLMNPVLLASSQDGRAVRIALVGDHAYAVRHDDLTGERSIEVYSLVGGGAPTHVGGAPLLGAAQIATDGVRLYVSHHGGVSALDITDPVNPVEIGSLDVPLALNMAAVDDRLLVAAGAEGLVAVDTSLPSEMSVVDRVAGLESGETIEVSGGVAVVAGDGEFLVYDVSDPRNPRQLGERSFGVNTSDLCVIGQSAYVVEGVSSGRLWEVSIADPASPSVSGFVSAPYARAIDVRNGYAYIGTSDYRFKVFDVRLSGLMTEVWSTSGVGRPTDVSVRGGRVFVSSTSNSGLNGGVHVFDISDPALPVSVGVIGEGDAYYGVHTIDGDRLYVSRLGDGVRRLHAVHVYDISDLEHPALIGELTLGRLGQQLGVESIRVYGDHLLVGARQTMYMIDASDPASLTHVARVVLPAGERFRDIAVENEVAYSVGDSLFALQLPPLGAALCPADQAPPFGSLDISDVIAFLEAFGAVQAAGDWVSPLEVWSFDDVIAFLGAFADGCP